MVCGLFRHKEKCDITTCCVPVLAIGGLQDRLGCSLQTRPGKTFPNPWAFCREAASLAESWKLMLQNRNMNHRLNNWTNEAHEITWKWKIHRKPRGKIEVQRYEMNTCVNWWAQREFRTVYVPPFFFFESTYSSPPLTILCLVHWLFVLTLSQNCPTETTHESRQALHYKHSWVVCGKRKLLVTFFVGGRWTEHVQRLSVQCQHPELLCKQRSVFSRLHIRFQKDCRASTNQASCILAAKRHPKISKELKLMSKGTKQNTKDERTHVHTNTHSRRLSICWRTCSVRNFQCQLTMEAWLKLRGSRNDMMYNERRRGSTW